jgi:hypothetical protein
VRIDNDPVALAAVIGRAGVNPPEAWRTRLCGLGPPGLGHKSFVVDR